MNYTTKHIWILYLVIILLLVTLFLSHCNRKPKRPDVIEIPAIEGVLSDSLPKEVIKDSVFIYRLRDTIIKYNRPIDTVYIKEFIKAPVEKKIEKYMEATAKREYKDTVEDEDIKLDYTANTEGKLIDIKFDYTIKPRTIEIPKPKEPVFTLYGGAGFKTTTTLESVTPTFSVGVAGKKGNIYQVQYGTDGSVQAGVMLKIFDIKK